MAAIVGAAGLSPALAAAQAGKRLLLANKEALVVAGALFVAAAGEQGAILPIDSEHNAIFQCLPADYAGGPRQVGVERILLTASGGPFRHRALDRLEAVTPAQACAHPNWDMGRKISVDSASMMNKGLEVIEAHWLFESGTRANPGRCASPERDPFNGRSTWTASVLAQMGNPDMRTPIAHALAWPERVAAGVEPLDLYQVARLDFEAARSASVSLSGAGLRRIATRRRFSPPYLTRPTKLPLRHFWTVEFPSPVFPN